MTVPSIRVATATLALLFAAPALAQEQWPEPEPGDLRQDPNDPHGWPDAPEDPAARPPERDSGKSRADERETIQITYTAWYVSFIDGQVERERGPGIGSKVSESDMELRGDWAHVFDIGVRINNWAAIRGQFFLLQLRGRDDSLREAFLFDGTIFNSGDAIHSKMDFHSYRLTAEFAYNSSGGMFAGGGEVGLRVFSVNTLIESRTTANSEGETRTQIWSPTLGGIVRLRGRLADDIDVGGMVRVGVFAFPEVAHQYRWAFFDFETHAYLGFWDTVRIEVGMRYLASHLRADHSHSNDERVEMQLWGGTLGISVLF